MTAENMNSIRLFFKGVKIDDRTEEYVRKRILSVNKLLDKILHIEVEIDRDKKGKFRVEVMIKTPYELFRTEETSESIEGSIDIAMEELKVQIRKHEDRRRTLIKRGGRSIRKKYSIDKNARF